MKSIKKFLYENRNTNWIIFFDKLLYRFSEHRIADMGASLVYFSILSVFPFLIALLNAINFTDVLQSDQLIEMLNYLPADIAKIAYGFVGEISRASSSGLFSISIIMGLYTASNVVHKLIKNISFAYGFKDRRGFFKLRGIALLFTLALIVMILLMFLTQIFGELIISTLSKYLPLQEHTKSIIALLGLLIPILYMVVTFTSLYRIAPSGEVKSIINYKSVIPGAIFATVACLFSSKLFGYYVINFSNYSVTYGSLGGIIVMLVWMWIMSIVVLLGAEINATLFSMSHFKSTNNWPRHESVLKNFITE
ncbi:MAG: YihY/virulence factor BrkB family protein [Peptoniphilus sp.]|nr:YihY/virulence factor BrkB family protein [Peptoniphilus sp.]